jgi:TolB-like protein/class 3 adenylate cyclase
VPVPAVERKLAAIFAADIAGYSRLMGLDETGTLERLKARREIMDRLIAAHRGRIFNTAGDSVIADFASAVDAVQCAVVVQEALAKENAGMAASEAMRFRIGIHVGDVIVEGTNLFGDAVNIAARLEAVAEPGGICVSGTVRDQIGSKLPIAFADLGEQQVKNIAQPIRAYRVQGKSTVTEGAIVAPLLGLPDKPSIAVLPFANMSGDPEQEYFADGMVEEIITALSRVRWLFVIARNSSFTYKGQAVDMKQVGRELGVRYVLEGSVRKASGRVRITAQLIDTTTGAHLWADRFDGSLEDVFDLQDQVAISVAGIIEPTLEAGEISRSRRRPTNDLTAYDLYLRALPVVLTFSLNERVLAAMPPLEEAIKRDPRYGLALSLAAVAYTQLFDWGHHRDDSRRKGIERAHQALEAAGDDPDVLVNAAFALSFLGEDIGTQIALIEKALALNPSFARGWATSGPLRIWAGQHDLAIEHTERSLRLNPRAHIGPQFWVLGIAHFFLRRFDEAAGLMPRAIQQRPAWPWPYRGLAACYAHMGRLAEAREVIAKLRVLTTEVEPRQIPFRRPEDRELFLSGLRLAAGEAS